MPEYQVIKRGDVPNAWQIGSRMPEFPKVRLHRGGTLFFSVLATEIMGDADCRVLAEYDETQRTLKLTTAGKVLPEGVTAADCFPMRIRSGKHNRRPQGAISIKALLTWLGVKYKYTAQDLEIMAIDRKARSLTVVLPVESPIKP